MLRGGSAFGPANSHKLPKLFVHPPQHFPSRDLISNTGEAYPLLSGLCDVFVGFEEAADVHSLTAPDVAVDCPVESEFEGTAVKRAAKNMYQRCVTYAYWLGGCSQDLWFGRHGRGSTGRRGLPMGLEGRLDGLSVLGFLYMNGRASLQYCDGVHGPKAQYAVDA